MLYVLLPCYNEENNVGKVIERIDKVLGESGYRVVAVDDGSIDSTYKVLIEYSKKYPVTVLKHEKNKGLHEALKTLFKWVLENTVQSDVAVTMDADNTHDPSIIPGMLEKLSKCDIVIASRYVGKPIVKGVPFIRRVLSKGLSILVRVFLGIPAKDVSSGYRRYKVDIIKKAWNTYGDKLIETKGFEVQLELLYKMWKLGAKICEHPIILDYSIKTGSKLKTSRTILRYLKLLYRLKFKLKV